MHRPRSTRRLLLTIWACALAFGFGLERQISALPGCLGICNDKCASHGGCYMQEDMGCDCYYFCEDGHDGEVLCTR